MEEIKNWWGVFGLFGCVTVVSSSLERRCHRQGSLTALTNLRSVAREKGVLLARPRQVCRNGNLSVCALKLFSFFLFLFLFLFFFFIKVSCFLYHGHVLGSVCVSSDLLSSALPSLSRCVGGFGYLEQLHRTCINTYYFHHPCVLKRLEIAFQCVVALGFPPAVFGIYSTCRATGTCTGNLCIISALLMLCLCRPLKSSTLWNKTPCFLSLPSLLTIPSFFYFLLPVSPYLLFSLIWFKKSLFNAALSSLFHL